MSWEGVKGHIQAVDPVGEGTVSLPSSVFLLCATIETSDTYCSSQSRHHFHFASQISSFSFLLLFFRSIDVPLFFIASPSLPSSSRTFKLFENRRLLRCLICPAGFLISCIWPILVILVIAFSHYINNQTLGAGLLAIPATFAQVGIVLGAACLVLFGFFTWYSIFMLMKSAEHVNVRNYEDLVAKAFPSFGRIGTTVFMNVLIFGALTGFVAIIGDVAMPLVGHIHVHNHHLAFLVQKPFVVCVLVALLVLPLCLLRRVSFLEYSSYLAVFIIMFFAGLICYLGITESTRHEIHWENLKYFDASPSMLFSALPVISLAYTCQLTVFPIWKELHNPTLGRMNLVVLLMTLIAFTLYTLVGVFGYSAYPRHTASNIIIDLPSTVFYDVVRAVFGVAILCHYPVVHFAFRNSIEVTFFSKYPFSWVRHIIITTLTVAGSTAWALLLPNLGQIFDVTGSFAAFPICFIIPSLVYLKLLFWDSGNPNSDPEQSPLQPQLQPRRGNLMSPPALLAIVVLVVTTVCCVISICEAILNIRVHVID